MATQLMNQKKNEPLSNSDFILKIKERHPNTYSIIELSEIIDEVAARFDSTSTKKSTERNELKQFYTKLAKIYNTRVGKKIFTKQLYE